MAEEPSLARVLSGDVAGFGEAGLVVLGRGGSLLWFGWGGPELGRVEGGGWVGCLLYYGRRLLLRERVVWCGLSLPQYLKF